MNWYKRQLKIAAAHALQLTTDQLDKIKNLVENKTPYYQIAKLFNVSTASIHRLNKKYKWRDTQEEKNKRDKLILGLYLLPPKGEGLSIMEIQNRTGMTHPTIVNTLKRLGLSDKLRGISEQGVRRFQDPKVREDQAEKLRRFNRENPQAAKDRGEKGKRLKENENEICIDSRYYPP